MSGSRIIEAWENGADREPPALITSLLRDGEDLLWAVRLQSIATAGWHIRLGLFVLILGGLMIPFAPWRETMEEFCSGSNDRCKVFYYIAWPGIAFVIGSAVFHLWSGWKASNRPWIIAYALSTDRAFLIDERRPKAFHYIYLRLHKPQIEGSGVLGFAQETNKFIGLDYGSLMRAYFWATEGRLAPAIDMGTPKLPVGVIV
jgi:hypothetical protein